MDLCAGAERTITKRRAARDAFKAVQTTLRHFSGDLMFDHKGMAARRSFLKRRIFASWAMEVQMCMCIKTVVLDDRMGNRCPVCGVFLVRHHYERKGCCEHLPFADTWWNPRSYIGRKHPPVYKYF